jgi:hypothetical protein
LFLKLILNLIVKDGTTVFRTQCQQLTGNQKRQGKGKGKEKKERTKVRMMKRIDVAGAKSG